MLVERDAGSRGCAASPPIGGGIQQHILTSERTWSECPRQESDLRTRFRKPVLYPLSYGGLNKKTLERLQPDRLDGEEVGREDPRRL
jgi:hypothetical protein